MMPNGTSGEPDRVFVVQGERAVIHPPPAAIAETPAADIPQGSTPHFVVSYDAGLASGATLADAVLATCEADYTTLQGYFGGITPPGLPFTVHLTTGSNGASHAGCASVDLYIGALSGGAHNIPFIRALVIAEEDEVFEAAFGHSWDCGDSKGEGLSRVLAEAMYPRSWVCQPFCVNSR